MATIRQVDELLKAGHTLPQIRDELHITPSRMDKIMESNRMKRRLFEESYSIPILAKKQLIKTAVGSFDRLCQLASGDSELARKASVDLLEQLSIFFPPIRPMRKSFFD